MNLIWNPQTPEISFLQKPVVPLKIFWWHNLFDFGPQTTRKISENESQEIPEILLSSPKFSETAHVKSPKIVGSHLGGTFETPKNQYFSPNRILDFFSSFLLR